MLIYVFTYLSCIFDAQIFNKYIYIYIYTCICMYMHI